MSNQPSYYIFKPVQDSNRLVCECIKDYFTSVKTGEELEVIELISRDSFNNRTRAFIIEERNENDFEFFTYFKPLYYVGTDGEKFKIEVYPQ